MKENDKNKTIINNSMANIWDLDCNCNMLNDISNEYAFKEDKSNLFSTVKPKNK